MDKINKIYSPRLLFREFKSLDLKVFNNLNNESVVILDRKSNELIGYINRQIENDTIVITFDLLDSFKGMGLQTESLREYLRYIFLWEKKYNLVKAYPNGNLKTINVLEKRFFDKKDDYYFISKDMYMSKVELLSLFDEKLHLLDRPNYRGEEIEPHTYAGIVDVIVKNGKTGKFLTTKRDINKVTSPGLWEITGGGIDYKEKIEDALKREVKEETGLDIVDYLYLKTTKIDDLVYFTYLGITNDTNVTLLEGETIDYKWRTKKEIIELFNTDLVPKKQRGRIKDLLENL